MRTHERSAQLGRRERGKGEGCRHAAVARRPNAVCTFLLGHGLSHRPRSLLASMKSCPRWPPHALQSVQRLGSLLRLRSLIALRLPSARKEHGEHKRAAPRAVGHMPAGDARPCLVPGWLVRRRQHVVRATNT